MTSARFGLLALSTAMPVAPRPSLTGVCRETAKRPIQQTTPESYGVQRVALAYACLVLIWASFVTEIRNQRRAVPPLPFRISIAFSLIAGMTVGVLLSLLGI